MYAMYDSYGSRRLGRERNFYHGGWAMVKIKERGSGGGVFFSLSPPFPGKVKRGQRYNLTRACNELYPEISYKTVRS